MKRLLAAVLALLMMFTVFTGCGKDDVDEEITEEDTYYNLQIDAFYDDNGERFFTVVENFDGEVNVEYNNIGYIVYPGVTVKEALGENYVTDFDIIDENGTFLGWMKYDYTPEFDEFGNDIGSFHRADDKLYTTEEILAIEITDCSLMFVAKWSDIDDAYYAEMGY